MAFCRSPRLLAAALLVAASSPAVAQHGTITGRVTDAASGSGLPGARVQVMTGARTAASHVVAADDGAFTISAIAAGTYDVVVTRIGYTPQRTANLAVAAGTSTTVNAALQVAPTPLDAIVATASRRTEKALDAPAQITVVSEEQVEERATVTVAGHVQSTPGVDVSQGGIAQSNIVARGFNNAFSGSMLMLQDYRFAAVPSLRVNMPLLFTGTNEDIERIEVLLGPASALFGPNSGNGVLHILSKSPFTSTGTTVTIDGGERSVMRGSLRSAHTFGSQVGVKVSGEFMRGNDFEYEDPGEPDSLTRGGQRVLNVRDFTVEKYSGEARLDYRPTAGMELISTVGSTLIGSGLELTGASGTGQVKNWRYTNLQQRFTWNRFFAQAFVNVSDAGNNDSTDMGGTFLLRSGQPIVDQSRVYSLQAQHGADVGTRASFTYGADYIFTNPRTGGTINGRNEEIDDIVEYGVYAQSTVRLTDRFDVLGALRADKHDQIDGTFLSPRVALIFKPTANQNVRATYNRAFNTPQNFSFFLDLLVARNPAGLPFNIRAMGNPPKEGWHFNRGCTGAPGDFCMRSAFVPTSNSGGGATTMIPALAGLGLPGLMTAQRNPLIAAVSAALQANGVPAAQAGPMATSVIDDMRGANAESLATITTVLATLGSTTPLDPNSIVDLGPLKASFNNTYELGYKGIAGQRFRFDVATWYQNRGDVATPATVATPNAFMTLPSLSGFMQPRISQSLQNSGMTQAQADAFAAAIASALAQRLSPVPMGTVTFDHPLAANADVFATYSRLEETVNLWGADLSLDYLLTDAVTLIGTYGYASKVVFEDVLDQRRAPFTLNAPGHKTSLTARYSSPVRRWGGEIRGRYTDAFPVNSGVYSSYGTFASPNPGQPAYSYPGVPVNMMVDGGVNYRFMFGGRQALWALTVTNLLNNEAPTFAGVPNIGRMAITRLQYTF